MNIKQRIRESLKVANLDVEKMENSEFLHHLKSTAFKELSNFFYDICDTLIDEIKFMNQEKQMSKSEIFNKFCDMLSTLIEDLIND